MKLVYGVDKIINQILKAVVVLMLGVMSIVVFAQVVFRIVHQIPVNLEHISGFRSVHQEKIPGRT